MMYESPVLKHSDSDNKVKGEIRKKANGFLP